jgi:hypothetical protein
MSHSSARSSGGAPMSCDHLTSGSMLELHDVRRRASVHPTFDPMIRDVNLRETTSSSTP